MLGGDAERVRLAARNNAEWCRSVAASHGVASRYELDGALWAAESPTPVGYPEAVTLEPGLDASAVLAAVTSRCPAASSLKDSFADLDLAAAGWKPRFNASWIVDDPSGAPSSPGEGPLDGPRLAPVSTAAGLARWARAHRLPDAFAAPLLATPGVLVLGAAAAAPDAGAGAGATAWPGDGLPVAGGVLNRTDEVVGLSNAFGGGSELFAALRREASARWPGLPVVGHESDSSLADALAAGFRPLGPLRIWIRPAQSVRQTT